MPLNMMRYKIMGLHKACKEDKDMYQMAVTVHLSFTLAYQRPMFSNII